MTAYVYTSGGFPSSPVSGDTLAINSAQYQWDGTTWVANTAPAGPTGATGPAGTPALVLISQSTAPTSPALGQQWFDTSQGVLYGYLSDGTDSAWLDQGAANSTTTSSNAAEDAEILALIGL